LWFVTGQGSKVGRIASSGAITLYATPNGGDPNNQILGIVVGSDGALWFTESYANKIGRITTSGVVTEYAAPGSEPWSIVSGPDGAVWFTELADIGRITTAGATSKFTVPTSNSLPWGLAVGSDGNMWFTEEKGGKIGRITTAGAITEFAVNSTGNDIAGIASGPDGALWFSDSGANKIGQITTAGVVTEYAIATSGSGPRLLVAGPDGAIWFTEQNGNKIGRVALAAAAAETQIFTNGNIYACSQTGSSQFTLAQAANVTHWGVWYYWASGETSVAATVKQGSATVFQGNLTRAACDPYQTSWCNADGVANATWPAGAYTVTISPAHMCMNSTSANQGFVYIYGAWQTAGSCTYTLSANSASPAAAGGSATVTVTASSGCAWTAASNATWITVTAGASGTGNGAVTYSVAANTGAARTGTLTIAGLTFTVTQAGGGAAGCSYNVSPTDIHATAAGLSNTLLIVTNSGCPWTASAPSGATWITLNPTSGSGGGAVGYSIAANTGAARSTTLTVAGTAVTVEQDAAASCYTLGGTSSPLISGIGGVGTVAVTVTGTGCAAWSVAAPSVNWVHVANGSGSTSSGTVSYSVDSNTAATKRSTTLTIANQSYTVQQDAAPCTYGLSSATSGPLSAGGASGGFLVTAAGPACTWAIALPSDTGSQWIHVISSLSAMSSGSVSYTVDPNNTTSVRSLALTIKAKNPATTMTYTVNQAAGTANTAPAPVVSPNGIVNAASFISAYLEAGSIAQGSFFSIFGNNLGPANPGMKATSYPLGTNLGGVSVKVTQGSTSVDAIPVFVAQYQINAVMPSNTPTGTVQVTVSYNGLTSAPAPVQVVVANFGAFTVSGGRGPGIVQNYVSATQLPLNMTSLTASPGDYAVLWGTGLGPLPGGASDTQPPAAGSLPASVQVLLGNQTITPAYAGRAPGLAGVDQIDFQLPANVTLGCYVPLQLVVNGNASNTVTMAINNGHKPCSDTSPFSSTSRSGGKNASIALARLSYTDPLNALKIGNGTIDIAMGTFNQSSGTGDLGFSLFASLPPINTCTYYNHVGGLNGLLGGQMPDSSNGATPLDAGSAITVKGPNGTQGVSYSDSSAKASPYLGVLGTGGGWSALGLGPSTPFLDPGTYTVSGLRGKDVGPFQYTLQIPGGATWTNRDSITTVDRSKGLTIQWSGGNPSTQAVAIVGYSSNPATNVSGAFACLSDMAPQSFTVPSNFLANLPATPTSSPGNAISALVFMTVPTADQFVSFNTSAAPSLDSGLGYYAVGELRNSVLFK
jgi:uncharacterized protein (TIGR03437 family)